MEVLFLISCLKVRKIIANRAKILNFQQFKIHIPLNSNHHFNKLYKLLTNFNDIFFLFFILSQEFWQVILWIYFSFVSTWTCVFVCLLITIKMLNASVLVSTIHFLFYIFSVIYFTFMVKLNLIAFMLVNLNQWLINYACFISFDLFFLQICQ